jgi:hypothetical protein
VLAHAEARSVDLDDDGMVEQAQGCGDHGIAEDVTPFGKAAVGGQDHCPALVACVDQLKEQIPAPGRHRKIANLIDDEKGGPAEIADTITERAFAFGLGKSRHKLGKRDEVDTPASADGFDGQSCGEVTLSGARRTRVILPNIITLIGRFFIAIIPVTVRSSRS